MLYSSNGEDWIQITDNIFYGSGACIVYGNDRFVAAGNKKIMWCDWPIKKDADEN